MRTRRYRSTLLIGVAAACLAAIPLAASAAPGELDSTFGTDGIVTTVVGTGADIAQAVAVQSDGKVVAAGRCYAGSLDFCLAR